MNKLKNFFIKISELFCRIFKKQNLMLNSPENNKNAIRETNDINTIKKLRIENKKNEITKDIIGIVENNLEVLKTLNCKQLEVIEEYYKNKIYTQKSEIKKVKNEIEKLKNCIEELNNKIKLNEVNINQ